jgi:hypothetical protein
MALSLFTDKSGHVNHKMKVFYSQILSKETEVRRDWLKVIQL